jgi:hypothetical protein
MYIRTDRALTVTLDGELHTIPRSHPQWTQINAVVEDEDRLRFLLNPGWGLPMGVQNYPRAVLMRLAEYRLAGLLDVALKLGPNLPLDAPITSDGEPLKITPAGENVFITLGDEIVATLPATELRSFFPPGTLIWDPPTNLVIEVGQIWTTHDGQKVEILGVGDDEIEAEHETYGYTTYTRDGRYYPDRTSSEEDLREVVA